MGSLCAGRAATHRAVRWGIVLPTLLAMITLVLPGVFTTTLGWPLALRMVTSLVLLVPVAFLMGFAFPLGMADFGEDAKGWYWALNGVSGVLAGVLSLALAIQIGFEGVLWLGTAGYLAAWLLLRWTPRWSRS